jgi:hypothetical protein
MHHALKFALATAFAAAFLQPRIGLAVDIEEQAELRADAIASPSIERTSSSRLRRLEAASHV